MNEEVETGASASSNGSVSTQTGNENVGASADASYDASAEAHASAEAGIDGTMAHASAEAGVSAEVSAEANAEAHASQDLGGGVSAEAEADAHAEAHASAEASAEAHAEAGWDGSDAKIEAGAEVSARVEVEASAEAHAEAAFNSIKSPQVYRQVTKFLATDPYQFISDFMDTKTRYHHNSVFNHYQELFKNSPDNKPKVKKPNNVKDFQNWVLNVKKDKLILGRYGADGDWGPSTINAWNKYGNEYLKSDRNDNLEDESESYDGFAIPFAFPDYEPTVDGHNIWDKFIGVVSMVPNMKILTEK